MKCKRFLVSLSCMTAFFCGCDNHEQQFAEGGCTAAYNDLYLCQSEKHHGELLRIETPVDCDEFADRLDDGAYWIERIDEFGETRVDFELVGETGWMFDGNANETSRCVLEEISTDSLIFSCHLVWRSSLGECGLSACSFRLPLKPDAQEIELPHRNSPCGIGFDQDAVNAVMKADSSAYSIVLNDSIVEIKILDTQITWTKRPGL